MRGNFVVESWMNTLTFNPGLVRSSGSRSDKLTNSSESASNLRDTSDGCKMPTESDAHMQHTLVECTGDERKGAELGAVGEEGRGNTVRRINIDVISDFVRPPFFSPMNISLTQLPQIHLSSFATITNPSHRFATISFYRTAPGVTSASSTSPTVSSSLARPPYPWRSPSNTTRSSSIQP